MALRRMSEPPAPSNREIEAAVAAILRAAPEYKLDSRNGSRWIESAEIKTDPESIY
jgi:hypothetical protein